MAAQEKAKQKPDYSFPMEGLELDPNDPYTFRIKLNQPYPQLKLSDGDALHQSPCA